LTLSSGFQECGVLREGVFTTSSVSFPFASAAIELPAGRENLGYVNLVIVLAPVIKFHPPVAIIFEFVVQFFSKTFIVIPSFIIIAEGTSPFTLA
jgi:hypothetical protein